jgi:hypothetical protein
MSFGSDAHISWRMVMDAGGESDLTRFRGRVKSLWSEAVHGQEPDLDEHEKAEGDYSLDGIPGGDSDRDEMRIAFLNQMLKLAESKGALLAEFRQKNLNYALLAFGGLAAFCFTRTGARSATYVACGLIAFMTIFCSWDRRLHRYTHGWRHMKNLCLTNISRIIKDSEVSIRMPSYVKKAEVEAERISFMPLIYYALVIAALAVLILSG